MNRHFRSRVVLLAAVATGCKHNTEVAKTREAEAPEIAQSNDAFVLGQSFELSKDNIKMMAANCVDMRANPGTSLALADGDEAVTAPADVVPDVDQALGDLVLASEASNAEQLMADLGTGRGAEGMALADAPAAQPAVVPAAPVAPAAPAASSIPGQEATEIKNLTNTRFEDRMYFVAAEESRRLASEIGLNVGVRTLAVKVNVQAALASESKTGSRRVTFVRHSKAIKGGQKLVRRRLSDIAMTAKGMFDADGNIVPSVFFKTCGYGLVSGVWFGGSATATLATTDESSSDKLEGHLKAKVGVSLVVTKVDVAINAMFSKLKEVNSRTVQLNFLGENLPEGLAGSGEAAVNQIFDAKEGGPSPASLINSVVSTAMRNPVADAVVLGVLGDWGQVVYLNPKTNKVQSTTLRSPFFNDEAQTALKAYRQRTAQLNEAVIKLAEAGIGEAANRALNDKINARRDELNKSLNACFAEIASGDGTTAPRGCTMGTIDDLSLSVTLPKDDLAKCPDRIEVAAGKTAFFEPGQKLCDPTGMWTAYFTEDGKFVRRQLKPLGNEELVFPTGDNNNAETRVVINSNMNLSQENFVGGKWVRLWETGTAIASRAGAALRLWPQDGNLALHVKPKGAEADDLCYSWSALRKVETWINGARFIESRFTPQSVDLSGTDDSGMVTRCVTLASDRFKD